MNDYKEFYFCRLDRMNDFFRNIVHFTETDLVTLFDPCGLRSSIKLNIQKWLHIYLSEKYHKASAEGKVCLGRDKAGCVKNIKGWY